MSSSKITDFQQNGFSNLDLAIFFELL